MNLASAAQSLVEQFPSGDQTDMTRREVRLEKLGNLAFVGFLFVMIFAVLGLLFAILGRLVVSGDNPLMGIAVMVFIIFGMMTLGYVFFRKSLKEKRKKNFTQESESQRVPPAVTARLIEEREFEPVPTITEETTNLLPTPKRNLQ
jgi:cytochrome c biogenesis protein CcdA